MLLQVDALAFQTSVMYLLMAFGIVCLAYIVARAVSFAYFRTKLEYLRSVLKHLNGGRNGKE